MAVRRPLVQAAGDIQEVPVGDTIDPTVLPSAGSVPLEILAGETYTVPANTQALFAIPFINNGTIINNGQLVQVRSA